MTYPHFNGSLERMLLQFMSEVDVMLSMYNGSVSSSRKPKAKVQDQ